MAGTIEESPNEMYSTLLYSTLHDSTLLVTRSGMRWWGDRFAKLSTPTEAMRQKAHGKGDGGLARQAGSHGPLQLGQIPVSTALPHHFTAAFISSCDEECRDRGAFPPVRMDSIGTNLLYSPPSIQSTLYKCYTYKC